jgi:ketosteroid isomerase-like protein
LSLVGLLILLLTRHASAEISTADAAEIRATVEGFHRALRQGDRDAALRLLAPDAMILESGEAQTREEYEREHLGEDMAFAKATSTERSEIKIERQADAAWATAKSKTTGTFNGRKIDSVGVELMVLTKSDSGWLIRAIHWSNRNQEKR